MTRCARAGRDHRTCLDARVMWITPACKNIPMQAGCSRPPRPTAGPARRRAARSVRPPWRHMLASHVYKLGRRPSQWAMTPVAHAPAAARHSNVCGHHARRQWQSSWCLNVRFLTCWRTSGVGQLDAGDEEHSALGGAGAEGGRSASTSWRRAVVRPPTLALAEQATGQGLGAGVDAAPDRRRPLSRRGERGFAHRRAHVLLNAAAAPSQSCRGDCGVPAVRVCERDIGALGATCCTLRPRAAVDACRILLDAGCAAEMAAANGSSALHWAAGAATPSCGCCSGGREHTHAVVHGRSTVRGNDSGQTPAPGRRRRAPAALEALLAEDPAAPIMRMSADGARRRGDRHPCSRPRSVASRRSASSASASAGSRSSGYRRRELVAGRRCADEQARDVEPPRLIRQAARARTITDHHAATVEGGHGCVACTSLIFLKTSRTA